MSISLAIFSRDACAAALRALCVMWYVDQMTPRNTINNNTKKSLCYSIKGWFSHNMTYMLRMNRVCVYTKRQLMCQLLRMTITKCFILHRITLPTINLDLVVDDSCSFMHGWQVNGWLWFNLTQRVQRMEVIQRADQKKNCYSTTFFHYPNADLHW